MQSKTNVHLELQMLCQKFDATMTYNPISDEYIIRFLLDPKGVFRVSCSISSYVLRCTTDNVADIFFMLREDAFRKFDVFYIIQECLRAGRFR